jgi:hypothetical protein
MAPVTFQSITVPKKKNLLLYDEVTEKNKERKGGKYHERKFDDQ